MTCCSTRTPLSSTWHHAPVDPSLLLPLVMRVMLHMKMRMLKPNGSLMSSRNGLMKIPLPAALPPHLTPRSVPSAVKRLVFESWYCKLCNFLLPLYDWIGACCSVNLEGILNNLSPWLQGAERLKALRAAIQEKIAAKQAANQKELAGVDEMLSLDSGDRVNDLIPAEKRSIHPFCPLCTNVGHPFGDKSTFKIIACQACSFQLDKH